MVQRILLAALLASGCAPALKDVHAVGSWHDLGSCRPTQSTSGLMIRGTRMRAPSATSAEMHCADGNHTVHFRAVSTLALDPPRRMNIADHAVVTARALDADGNELILGQGDLEWSVTPPLTAGPRCDKMVASCLGDDSIRVVAGSRGQARITASLAGVSAQRDVVIE